MAALLAVVTLLLSQAPGDGWGTVDSRPREVKRVYWDLFQTTEVWVTLSPVTASSFAGPRFAFQAFFPGREAKGRPQRIQVKALAGGATSDFSLRVVIDGKTTDLTGPDGTSFLLYPPCGEEWCSPNGVAAELKAELLCSMADTAHVQILAFGSAFPLSSEDRAALAELVKQIGFDASTRGMAPR